MNKVFFWSITVAVAGFLFGFDVAVISGADQPIQLLWQTTPLFHGLFIMSSALWGTVIGALAGNWPCDKWGRKPTLIAIGCLFLVSAIGSALAPDPYTFSFFRLIGGLGVGASSIAVPAYISEIAPAKYRGRLVALYQFQLVFGILVAFLSNYMLSGISAEDWRWMLAVESLPALVFLLLVSKVPESPRWLLLYRNSEVQARQVLSNMLPSIEDVNKTISEIKSSRRQAKDSSLFTQANVMPLTLAFLIAFFNQASGINFIIYFAPRVFEIAGLDTSTALLSSAGIGLTNLIFTMLGVYLIDRVGRRPLMLIGSIGYIVSLAVVAYAFFAQLSGLVVVFFIFTFIASHAVGQGAVIWVFIAEIFPNHIRAKGSSWGCGIHWIGAAVITLCMPLVLSQVSPHHIFGFFCFMMIFQLLFVIFVMPETKGKSLEALSEKLDGVEELAIKQGNTNADR
ncbi:MAG: sugar porter family MFS transporter [Alteromonadaceae bacterium]|nr:sugar porter family MFS transporter [Alteromonadaceae bacterium]